MAFDNNMERIAYVVDFIEEHAHEKIVLDVLSENAGLSKYHLHRIFKSVTNHSLMEYVRCRKLAHSVRKLLDTQLKIIDIAFEYGFSQEQNYIRSFKRAFNISPSQYRKKQCEIKIVDMLDIKRMNRISGGFVMDPQYVIRPRLLVVGIGYYMAQSDNYFNSTANKAGRNFFYYERKLIKKIKNPEIYLALAKSDIQENVDYYFPCTEVNSLEDIPSGMEGRIVPAGKYAVFKYIGFHSIDDITMKMLSDIYTFIFAVWIPTSSCPLDINFHMERIDTSVAREDYCEMEILIPVPE